MKLKELVNSEESIIDLLTQDLPIEIAFDLNVFIEKVEPELTTFKKIRLDLFKELGEQDGDKFVVRNEDNMKKLNEELDKLGEKELEIEVPKITMSELKGVKIKPISLRTLNWLIK